jgi:hypothetical protein
MKSCEPSDFVEEQGGYGGRLCKQKIMGERVVDSCQ